MSQCSQQEAFDDGGKDKPADGVMGDVQNILLNDQQNVVQDNTAAANAVESPTKGLFLRSKIETASGYQDESLPEVRLVQVLNLASDISRIFQLVRALTTSVLDSVVHVTALCPDEEIFTLEDLFPDGNISKKKEFIFRFHLSRLLVGDLTQELLEEEADRLLCGLMKEGLGMINARQAIVFVAYDVGSLVVETALSRAARSQDAFSRIFWNTARIVFSGCPLRSAGLQEMKTILWDFLSGMKEEGLSHLITLDAVENLAQCALQATTRFVNSKITLRCRTISLYANKSLAGKIHMVFTSFTATLGIPSEVAIQEQHSEEFVKRFLALPQYLIFNFQHSVSHPVWLPIEQTLLALSAPHRICRRDCQQDQTLQAGLDTAGRMEWSSFIGPQILYIHGASYRTTHDLADRILLSWVKELQEKDVYDHARVLSFTFDSKDPLRDETPDMMASVLIQSIAGRVTGSKNPELEMFQDQFVMGAGWSEKSCLSLFEAIRTMTFNHESILLLHDFDQCNSESRKQFLKYYAELASGNEGFRLKLAITSRKPNSLLEELSKWQNLNVDDLSFHTDSGFGDPMDDLTRLFPRGIERMKVKELLGPLFSQHPNTSTSMIQMLQNYSGWPRSPSRATLSRFTHNLGSLARSETQLAFLNNILKSEPDRDGVRWGLTWLLCTYRPLSHQEFTFVMRHHHREQTHEPRTAEYDHSDADATETQIISEPWLHLLVDFGQDQVTIRREIWDLLEECNGPENYIWDDVRKTAHETIAQFCLAYLTSSTAAEALSAIFRKYQSQMSEQQQSPKIIPPIIPDCEEISSYVVQALPYHLIQCSPRISKTILSFCDDVLTTECSLLWAKVYWAMSNTLSRTPAPPTSALPVLVRFGLISYESVSARDEALISHTVFGAIANGLATDALRNAEGRSLPASVWMEVLGTAVQAGDQDTALIAAQNVVSMFDVDEDKSQWPRFIIWAAVWLDMTKLTEILLREGKGVRPSPGFNRMASWNTPLHMAATLGHSEIATIFLATETSTAEREENVTNFCVSARRGHIGVVRAFLEHGEAYLKAEITSAALYDAACMGQHHVVHELLARGANPQYERGRSPLIDACSNAFPQTVQALLEGGADPNSLGPYGMDTPLWFAAVKAANIECVLALLNHNGDPNHERLWPPLMNEMVRSSHNTDTMISIAEVLFNGALSIDINSSGSSGKTALMLASESGKLDFVRWLIIKDADVDALDDYMQDAMYYAVSGGHAEVVEVLLRCQPKLNVVPRSTRDPLLFTAIQSPKIFQMLLEAGANPNVLTTSGSTVINKASSEGNAEIVKMLVERAGLGTENATNVDHKDVYGWPPICDAISYTPNATIVRLLADCGARLDVVCNGFPLLHRAVKRESTEILQILLEFRKALDINVVDSNGQTALHEAVNLEMIEHVRILIKAGADLNAADNEGETILHRAACQKDTAILSLLLAQEDVEVDMVPSKINSPLQVACLNANIDAVRALINKKADVERAIPESFRSTPLMAALLPFGANRSEYASNIDTMTRILVHSQAPVHQKVRGSRFYTALSIACFGAGVGTLNFLLDQGAPVQLADPNSGRLPLHFAAANGIENLQAILLSYKGDLMAADKEGKNCLHWAAQMGNAQATKFILDRLGSDTPGLMAQYINQGDSDGWTPLCWAMRQCDGYIGQGMRSEKLDFAGVVRTLLDHGADPLLPGTLGSVRDGESSEMSDQFLRPEKLTPLELAHRFGADHDIIKMLEDATGIRDSVPCVRWLRPSGDVCDICLNPVDGPVFDCNDCPDFCACAKCHPHVATFHAKNTQNDGRQHTFRRRLDRPEEIDERPQPENASDKDETMSDGQRTEDEEQEQESDEMHHDDYLDEDLGDIVF